MIIPIEGPLRLHAVKLSTSDASITALSSCLMLLNSNALNMVPFFAFLLTLNHGRIFIWLAISTYTILLWILSESACFNTSFYYGLSPLYFFQLILGIFLRLAGNRSITILSISIPSFLFLLWFRIHILLRI